LSTQHHLCISVSGALKNFKGSNWRGCFHDSRGRDLTQGEAKAYLVDCLEKGWKVIPFGEPCEGFDYKGGGCPGHPMPDPPGLPPWAPDHLQTTCHPEGA